MRIFTLCSLILISTNFFAQSLKIDVEWDGEKSYTLEGNTFVVPNTKNFKNNFSYGDYFRITMQWNSEKIIDDSSVVISNILYEDFDLNPYSGLQKVNFNNNINVTFNSSMSKGKIFSFLELDPIIFKNGVGLITFLIVFFNHDGWKIILVKIFCLNCPPLLKLVYFLFDLKVSSTSKNLYTFFNVVSPLLISSSLFKINTLLNVSLALIILS